MKEAPVSVERVMHYGCYSDWPDYGGPMPVMCSDPECDCQEQKEAP